MIKIKYILSLVVLTTISVYGQDLPSDFTELLNRSSMTFTLPNGLKSIPIIQNDQMNYEFAIKYPKYSFEVRFAIRPLDLYIEDYEERERNKNPGDINIHPNNLYKSLLEATILNISGGQLPPIQQFDSQAVKSEFNADWGATSFVNVGQEFGQSYKYCMVVAIHKQNLADAYIFFLANTKDNFSELMFPAFHSLQFRK